MCLCVSKMAVEQFLSDEDMSAGAYFLTNDKADVNIMSSGADIEIAMNVRDELKKYGIISNVISMLSLEVFEKQPTKIKNKFLNKPLFVVETSTCAKYLKYTDEKRIFNVTEHGVSGNSESLKKHFGFDPKVLANKIKKEIKK